MISFWLLVVSLFTPSHDFHTSWMNMTYLEDKKQFEISWRTDTEHLESVLSAFTEEEVRLDENSSDTYKNSIENYILNHLDLQLNKNRTKLKVEIIEVTFAETIIHFEAILFRKKLKSIYAENTLLIHAFPNQKNMIQLNYCGEKNSLLLSRTKTAGIIDLYH